MAKGFGKFLLTVTALGAAAVGAYYVLEKKNLLPKNVLHYDPDEEDEDFDHFEDYEEDPESNRSYFSLNPTEESCTKNEEALQTEASEARTEEFFNDEEA